MGRSQGNEGTGHRLLPGAVLPVLAVMLLAALLLAAPAAADPKVDLIANLETGDSDSNSREGVASGGKLYFVATNGLDGSELYVTDGTEGGTEQLTDQPVVNGGAPDELFVASDGTKYFSLDGSSGRELYTVSGASDTVARISNIAAGADDSDPEYLAELDGFVYFAATGPDGEELYRTDGTFGGTTLFKDIRDGSSSSRPEQLMVAGGLLYFYADGGDGKELWKSDGTPGGTVQVQDIRSGTGSGVPLGVTTPPIEYDGFVYFPASSSSATGFGLWRSDGTIDGATEVKQIGASSSGAPQMLGVAGGSLYFSANDGSTGLEIWESDGTSGGTVDLDLNPGPPSSSPRDAAVVDSSLAFTAQRADVGRELFAADGSGADLVEDIRPGTSSSQPGALLSTGSELFFRATTDANGPEMWLSKDLDAGSTGLVIDARPGPLRGFDRTVGSAGGTVFVSSFDPAAGFELFETDGTGGGTSLVANINQTEGGSDPALFAAFGGQIAFAADLQAEVGPTLIASNGTPGSATGLQVFPASGSITPSLSPEGQTGAGDLIFRAERPGDSGTIHVTDGTPGGAEILLDTDPPGSPTIIDTFIPFGAGALFAAGSFSGGNNLYRTDGSPVGTELVGETDPGGDDAISSLVELDGTAYFAASDGFNGQSLWRTDGETIQFVRDVPGDLVGPIVVVGGELMMFAVDGTASSLWRSDGSFAGTEKVADLSANTLSRLTRAEEVDGRLFFVERDDATGPAIWTSNGTPGGTAPVEDLPGDSSSPDIMGKGLGKVFFSFSDPSTGSEIYVSDGTPGGTGLLTDIRPGSQGSIGSGARGGQVGDRFFFVANDGTRGSEIWETDGTGPGTVLTEDLVPGGGSSSPNRITFIDDRMFFGADDGIIGREPYVLTNPDEDPPQTTIDSETVDGDSATFEFSSDEPGSSFECRVDGAGFSSCSGPGDSHTTGSLPAGDHSFEVRAIDPSGNTDASPAATGFTIESVDEPDTELTDFDVTTSKKYKDKGKRFKLPVSAGLGEDGTLIATASLVIPGGKGSASAVKKTKLKLKKVKKKIAEGQRKVLRLKVKKKKDEKKLRKAIKKSRKAKGKKGKKLQVKARVRVRATDLAGNSADEKRVIRIK